MNFADFSCVIFWAQNVRIPPNCILLEYLSIPFYPCIIIDWNKLDHKVRDSNSYLSFRNALINFVRPSENKIFIIYDQVGTKLLPTRGQFVYSPFGDNNLVPFQQKFC